MFNINNILTSPVMYIYFCLYNKNIENDFRPWF